jgi:hypothetical protein
MARIPTVSAPPVQNIPAPQGGPVRAPQIGGGRQLDLAPMRVATVQGAPLSESAMNARYRGGEKLGESMIQAAQIAGNYALRAQDQKNKGILASEENIRIGVAGGIQKAMQETPDSPEAWGKVREKAWKDYETGRAKRRQTDGWAPIVIAADGQSYQDYRAKLDTEYGLEESKAVMRQANGRMEANAQMKLRAGDYEGFIASMDQMDLFPDQREAKIRAGLEEGTYKTANNQLDSLHDLPPANSITATKNFIADLNAKDEKTGRYINFEYDRGGLSIGGRVNLTSIANARIREAERQMDVTGRRLVSELRLGRATTSDVDAAVKDGSLTMEEAKVLSPDIALAVREHDDRLAAKDAAVKAHLQEQAQQREASLSRLRVQAVEKGNIGFRDIERQVALGEITAVQGAQLQEELGQASRAEIAMDKGDFQIIQQRIRGGTMSKMFGRQPSESEYRDIQNAIIAAKLTKESRMGLMQDLYTMKLADMSDLQEEGPTGRWLDREITAPERNLRKNMIDSYKQMLPALGDTLAGDLLFNQESKIRAFFETGGEKGRTDAEIVKFRDEALLPEVQKAAGFQAMRDAFNY